MIKWLIWTIWTPVSSVLKKVDKLNLSLSLLPHCWFSLANLCWQKWSHVDTFSPPKPPSSPKPVNELFHSLCYLEVWQLGQFHAFLSVTLYVISSITVNHNHWYWTKLADNMYKFVVINVTDHGTAPFSARVSTGIMDHVWAPCIYRSSPWRVNDMLQTRHFQGM